MGLSLLLVAALGAYGVLTYNKLARLRLLAANAWSDIDVQLKRRHDLVPSLVETVKGHAGYERQTLEAVVAARNRALQAGGPEAAGEAERDLAASVRQVFVLAEAYPEIRATEGYLSLQRTLTEIENTIQDARRYYNAVVRDLNTTREQFPSSVVAQLFGFGPIEFFMLTDAAEGATPTIDLEGGSR
jgi:LemA protein